MSKRTIESLEAGEALINRVGELEKQLASLQVDCRKHLDHIELLTQEFNRLQTANEKLRKVAEAARAVVNADDPESGCAELERVLAEVANNSNKEKGESL